MEDGAFSLGGKVDAFNLRLFSQLSSEFTIGYFTVTTIVGRRYRIELS